MTNWWFYIKLVFPVTTWPLRITRTCYSLQFAGKLHEHAISGSNCSHLLCFANIFTCLAESQKSPSRPHSRLHLSYQNYLQFMSKICCLIIFISVPGRIMSYISVPGRIMPYISVPGRIMPLYLSPWSYYALYLSPWSYYAPISIHTHGLCSPSSMHGPVYLLYY